MSETTLNESNSLDSQVPAEEDVQFPLFPAPRDVDFEDDINEDEREFYKNKFIDLNVVTFYRLHCTACDRHLGCSASNDGRMRSHPLLRTLVCNTCFAFYNSGEFEKGDDGSELYCRWCGQGGQVYCCADCPHVFCAKCIKRNLGLPKIKEIENTDDWKCFKCNNKPLWDLRAACWALMRYCDLKNRITMATQDLELKEKYQAICNKDFSECCKNKKRRDKLESKKREEKREADNQAKKAAEISAKKVTELSAKKATELSAKKATELSAKKATAVAISKIPPTIQVKKFASINIDESKQDKKGIKRSISPKTKSLFLKNPIAVSSNTKQYGGVNIAPMPKKIRLSSSPIINPVRFVADRKAIPPPIRIRPKAPQMPNPRSKAPQLPIPIMSPFNGYNNSTPYTFINDNINLSLESLTQGLDMAAVAAMNNNDGDDDVVCTPDFPMEPLCEVTEDNTDDDVQCITPAPRLTKLSQPPPLVPRLANTLPELSPENIVQMTENDVTVNAQTGGLKFRVDPQTLSSNKMYRLPDGRIFAINANPNMPGGYSATIVAVTESSNKTAPKGATYAAKLSAVTPQAASPALKPVRTTPVSRPTSAKRPAILSNSSTKVTRGTETISRDCDLNVSVEWYRYNLIDAVDALEYRLSRLRKINKEATTMHLRTRTLPEMRALHRTLDRLLYTSSTRFNEIRDNLNKGMKQYLSKKCGGSSADNISDDYDDEDDDVEILPNPEENDDPIYIDENSIDSNANDTSSIDHQEVDLTGAMSSSDLNDSGDKIIDIDENFLKSNEEIDEKVYEKEDTASKTLEELDPLANTETEQCNENNISMEEEPSNKITFKEINSDQNENNIEDQELVSTNKDDTSVVSKDEDKDQEIVSTNKDDTSVVSGDEDKDQEIVSTNKDDKSGVSKDEDNEKELVKNCSETSLSESHEEKQTVNGKKEHMDLNLDSVNKNLNAPSEISETKTDDHEQEQNEFGEDINKNDDHVDEKLLDTEMSEEMIETLLKDDDGVDEEDSTREINSIVATKGDDVEISKK